MAKKPNQPSAAPEDPEVDGDNETQASGEVNDTPAAPKQTKKKASSKTTAIEEARSKYPDLSLVTDSRLEMARKIWDTQPHVRILVTQAARQPGQKAKVEFALLASINGIDFTGQKGKSYLVPAEVARIAITAGVALAAEEMPEDFVDELTIAGTFAPIAQSNIDEMVDPVKAEKFGKLAGE